MKKIALLLPAMRMGGAEKICLNFLDDLVRDNKVTIILSATEGELLPYIPKSVEVIEDRIFSFKEIFRIDLYHFRLKFLLKDFIYYLKVKTGNDTEKNYSYLISRTPARKEHYDCVISYVANVSTQVVSAIDRINADKKIAWLHGETTELKDTDFFSSYYMKFDKIYAVSKMTKAHFLNRFPECEKITDVYYNPIKKTEIIEKANEQIDFMFDNSVPNIVTVGRISPEKGMDMIPEIIVALLQKKLKIHWFIVGDGSEAMKLKEKIENTNLHKYITMTGNLINPYPLIKQCDIYVQPSYEEGYSTTICEAAILGKVIVGTTTSGGIREQITDGIDGLLAEPKPVELAAKIEELIINHDKRKELETNICLKDFSNENEYQKLKSFLEGEVI